MIFLRIFIRPFLFSTTWVIRPFQQLTLLLFKTGHFILAGVAHAWVVDQAPSWGHERGNHLMFLSHINVSLPLFRISLKIILKNTNRTGHFVKPWRLQRGHGRGRQPLGHMHLLTLGSPSWIPFPCTSTVSPRRTGTESWLLATYLPKSIDLGLKLTRAPWQKALSDNSPNCQKGAVQCHG